MSYSFSMMSHFNSDFRESTEYYLQFCLLLRGEAVMGKLPPMKPSPLDGPESLVRLTIDV